MQIRLNLIRVFPLICAVGLSGFVVTRHCHAAESADSQDSRVSPNSDGLDGAAADKSTAGRLNWPRLLDDRLRLELVAIEPEIVTPIALTFDTRGRLLVVESHTHQRPDDYTGPPHDRIRVLEDRDGDGQTDGFSTFFEGTESTMSMMTYLDGSIYVATRMEIFRLRDTDGDGKADQRTRIAHLDTPGDYPHNGLSGLTYDSAGFIYFGFGENLGAPYELIGSDGTTLVGEAEGGNVYRCDADGKSLTHVATGFWNPFSLCFDSRGRLFAVDNDPDGRPPCRLLHVVQGGDYGYQFRYGRSGHHPLQAWDGGLPGCLPMAAGTGEAPSAVLPYHGRLWVTSWGDHRIERYGLRPRGATCQAIGDIVVQGGENFRPVDLAVSPDGALYFSDWVNRSYPVHGQGRIWRLSWKEPPPKADFPELSMDEQRAAELERIADVESLDTTDPFVRQAAIWGVTQADLFESLEWRSLPTAAQRLGVLQSMRWKDPDIPIQTLNGALHDDSADVRLFALRVIAEQRRVKLRQEVLDLLNNRPMTLALFHAIIATLEWLDQDTHTKDKDAQSKILISALNNAQLDSHLRAMAVRLLEPNHEYVSSVKFRRLLSSDHEELRLEAVRTISLREDSDLLPLLETIATDERASELLRAEALVGLGRRARHYRATLIRLTRDQSEIVRREAMRGLRPITPPAPVNAALPKPPVTETDAWLAQIGEGGDVEAGRRLFYSPVGPNCSRCHRHQGRGNTVGPDLTEIGRRLSKRRLLESILQPSLEVAPRFSPWLLETDDGQLHKGLAAPQPYSGNKKQVRETFVAEDGSLFVLDTASIVSRRMLTTSIMPDGLEKLVGIDELRDLIAFLTAR